MIIRRSIALPASLQAAADSAGNLSGLLASLLAESEMRLVGAVGTLRGAGLTASDWPLLLMALARGAHVVDPMSDVAAMMLRGASCPELSPHERRRIDELAELADADETVAAAMLRLAREAWRGARDLDQALGRLPPA